MGLTKYKLGELIEQSDKRNVNETLTVDDVRGISTNKSFVKTKANMNGVSIKSYKTVNVDEFAYVADTSRRGDKIAIAYNVNEEKILVSSIYTVFYIKRKDLLLSDYLFMYFNRAEFDRYSRFNSWGSARETFCWEDMRDIEIDLPPLAIQKKYVDIYNAMLANQQSYEQGLEDLKLAMDVILEQHKNNVRKIPLKDLLIDIDVRNDESVLDNVYGVAMTKRFIPSVANLNGVNISRYKIVQPGQMASNFMHVGRDKSLPIAINKTTTPILVSPAYFVFEEKTVECLAEFVLMWFSRVEFGRYCWYISDTSVRGGFSLECFYNIEIPIPTMEIQKSLVELYNVYIMRKEINEKLKSQIKSICPILIKGSIEEAGNTKEA